MIETPYKMLIEAEVLNAQTQFYIHAAQNLDADIETATESVDYSKEPPLKTLLSASINYVAVTVTRNIKKALREFIREIKHVINTEITKLLVKIGVDDENCIDRSNVCEFLKMEWDRIISLQTDINQELKYMRRGSMNRLNVEKYSKLSMKARMLSADFQRWSHHTEPKEVPVAIVKAVIDKFKKLIHELEVTEKELDLICTRLEASNITETTSQNISELMTVVTYSINSYTLIVNTLAASINPLQRGALNTINAVKKLNPGNWYNDDVDLKVAEKGHTIY